MGHGSGRVRRVLLVLASVSLAAVALGARRSGCGNERSIRGLGDGFTGTLFFGATNTSGYRTGLGGFDAPLVYGAWSGDDHSRLVAFEQPPLLNGRGTKNVIESGAFAEWAWGWRATTGERPVVPAFPAETVRSVDIGYCSTASPWTIREAPPPPFPPPRPRGAAFLIASAPS